MGEGGGDDDEGGESEDEDEDVEGTRLPVNGIALKQNGETTHGYPTTHNFWKFTKF